MLSLANTRLTLASYLPDKYALIFSFLLSTRKQMSVFMMLVKSSSSLEEMCEMIFFLQWIWSKTQMQLKITTKF